MANYSSIFLTSQFYYYIIIFYFSYTIIFHIFTSFFFFFPSLCICFGEGLFFFILFCFVLFPNYDADVLTSPRLLHTIYPFIRIFHAHFLTFFTPLHFLRSCCYSASLRNFLFFSSSGSPHLATLITTLVYLFIKIFFSLVLHPIFTPPFHFLRNSYSGSLCSLPFFSPSHFFFFFFFLAASKMRNSGGLLCRSG